MEPSSYQPGQRRAYLRGALGVAASMWAVMIGAGALIWRIVS